MLSRFTRRLLAIPIAAALCLLAVPAFAEPIQWVTVGDPGNAADTAPTGYGAVALAGSANTAVTAFSPINGMIENGGIANGNALMVFTVSLSDITVSALGSFNGYDGTRAVGIFAWNGSAGSGEPLVSGNVSTDNTQGGFSYAACDIMTLTARLQYVLVGQTVVGSSEYVTSFPNAGAGSGISFDSYWYNGAVPLNATPSNTSADPFPYFGPNFQFSVVPVPEPTTYAMAVAGLVCGGSVVCRRRKRA